MICIIFVSIFLHFKTHNIVYLYAKYITAFYTTQLNFRKFKAYPTSLLSWYLILINFMPANSITEVIVQLTEIVEKSRRENSQLGYFAALYRKVTIRIRDGIAKREFDDNERMERLDVIFANRYIDAYNAFKSTQTPTQSWSIAFIASQNTNLLILQHLLLGINAHINLDLGIAAAQAVGDGKIQHLKNDFDKINSILAEMVDDVQSRLGKASPVFGILDPLTKRLDEDLANFTIGQARDGAWKFANAVFVAKASDLNELIKERDIRIALLAKNLASPGSGWMRSIISFIRFFATKNVSKVIDLLAA